MPSLKQEPQKQYYFCQEVAKALGVNPSHIRYYGAEFNLGFKGSFSERIRISVKQVGQLATILRLTDYLKIEAAKVVFNSGRSEKVLEALGARAKEPVLGSPVEVKWFAPDNRDGVRSLKQHAFVPAVRHELYTGMPYPGNKSLCSNGSVIDESELSIPFDQIEAEPFNETHACARCLKMVSKQAER